MGYNEDDVGIRVTNNSAQITKEYLLAVDLESTEDSLP